MASAAGSASQVAVALAAVVWTACFVRPAEKKSTFRSAESSTLDRWHEVATALPEPAPQVYLGSPSGSLFLEDVVMVVDRVMKRNAAIPEK
jgi:hypothetical protein